MIITFSVFALILGTEFVIAMVVKHKARNCLHPREATAPRSLPSLLFVIIIKETRQYAKTKPHPDK
jgi:hypothetical protein